MLAVGIPSSALPRPKPLTTGPERRIGKGGWGPVGGPTAVRGRGAEGRILGGLGWVDGGFEGGSVGRDGLGVWGWSFGGGCIGG